MEVQIGIPCLKVTSTLQIREDNEKEIFLTVDLSQRNGVLVFNTPTSRCMLREIMEMTVISSNQCRRRLAQMYLLLLVNGRFREQITTAP